jgi:hypothetical protein
LTNSLPTHGKSYFDTSPSLLQPAIFLLSIDTRAERGHVKRAGHDPAHPAHHRVAADMVLSIPEISPPNSVERGPRAGDARQPKWFRRREIRQDRIPLLRAGAFDGRIRTRHAFVRPTVSGASLHAQVHACRPDAPRFPKTKSPEAVRFVVTKFESAKVAHG